MRSRSHSVHREFEELEAAHQTSSYAIREQHWLSTSFDPGETPQKRRFVVGFRCVYPCGYVCIFVRFFVCLFVCLFVYFLIRSMLYISSAFLNSQMYNNKKYWTQRFKMEPIANVVRLQLLNFAKHENPSSGCRMPDRCRRISSINVYSIPHRNSWIIWLWGW